MKKRCAALLLAALLLVGSLPVCAAEASGPKLAAITFDDGPGPYTAGLLDELAKRDVAVTFFMQGYRVPQYAAVVKQAYEAGHQIASHTYDHPQLTKLSNSAIMKQLAETAAALDSATGVHHSYMVRPPYGSADARVLSALNAPAVLWSVDTLDWKSRNADAVFRRIVEDTRDGSIVLLHDIHPTSIPGALRGIDALLAQGYELVTVSELLRRRGQEAAPGVKYYSAYGTATLPGIASPVLSCTETEAGRLVTLTADAGARIYYTADGTAPTSQSTLYTGPFLQEDAAVIKAFAAYTLNGGRSRVSASALDAPQAKAPVIAVEDGMAVLSANGEIHYTLDGTTPTVHSERYTGPVPLPAGVMLQAITVQPGGRSSQVSSLLHSALGNLFSDVQSEAREYPAIDRAVSLGLLSAPQQRFSPQRSATRREAAAALYRLSGGPGGYEAASIPDVPEADPAHDALAWALERQLLTAGPDGGVRPNAPVTREQLAVMLYRLWAGESGGAPSPSMLYAFLDWETVQESAREGMDWAVSSGRFDGLLNDLTDAVLAPGRAVTRAQLADVLLGGRADASTDLQTDDRPAQ